MAGAALLVAALAAATEAGEPMTFPKKDWAEATPAAVGVDAAGLADALRFLAEHTGKDATHETVVIRRGFQIWRGDRADRMHGVWSVTKSFTSACLGLLVADGKCTPDTPAAQAVPALAEHYGGVTLRHFATMTSGYRAAGDEPRGSYVHGPSPTPFDPSPQPLFAPPGSKYAYWDSAMNMFALVLTRLAGEPLEDLFRRRVAEPIGMNASQWDWGDFGPVGGGPVVNGGSGNANRHVRITPTELARLGHLYLNRGAWNGRQVLPAAWVDEATRVHVAADLPWAQPESKIDGRGVYGLNWWINGAGPDGKRRWPDAPPRTFCAAGFNNNRCFVVPEWEMVVVRMGLDGDADEAGWNGFFARLAKAVTVKE
jgi:CubicO group peptidase (beta-lactamase class C family)